MQQKAPILALAPMAGYTDSAFRLICLKNGADIVYTEMISTEAIWRKNEKTLRMLDLLPGEKNIVIQLFGTSPESFAKSVKFIEKYSARNIADKKIIGIDINFGCPAKKVFNTGAGASLMLKPNLAREIIKSTIENTSLPISIKIRSGIRDKTAIWFLDHLKDLPIDTIMIHGRTYEQGFSGSAGFDQIKEIKKIFPTTTILANGNIDSPEKAKEILEKTNVDGLGLATHVLGNPFLFKQIKDYLKKQKYKKTNFRKVRKTFIFQAKKFLKYSDDLASFRKHLIFYLKNTPHAKQLRQQAIKSENLTDIKKIK
jgi:tRNA-dihydrouridine synthase B